MITMLLFEWLSLFETVGFKLAEGKGLREGWDSKELWKSVEKAKAHLSRSAKDGPPAHYSPGQSPRRPNTWAKVSPSKYSIFAFGLTTPRRRRFNSPS